MNQLFFTLGLALVGILLVQVSILLYASVRRSLLHAAQRNVALQEWKLRIRVAEQRLHEAESEKLQWTGWRKFEVRRKSFENDTKSICSFYLYPHDRRPLPLFDPGQFLMFRCLVPDPRDPEKAIQETRCYSLSDSANHRYYRVSIRKVAPPDPNPDGVPPGMVSNFLHESIHVGDLIDVAAPSGDFLLDTTRETPVCLIAAGVGFTPILSMCNALIDYETGREVWIFLGFRDEADLAMIAPFEHAADKLTNGQVRIFLSDETNDSPPVCERGLDNLKYNRGRVTLERLKENLPSNAFDFYICGPEPMMNDIRQGLAQWGVSEEHIFYEAFAPSETSAGEEGDERVGPARESTVVALTVSNQSFTWNGEKSIYALFRKNDFRSDRIRFSCRQGKCGSCLTAIKSGTVEYPGIQPSFPRLETGYCLPCICVPKFAIELEV